jgi:Dual OB-containing domain
MSYRKTLLCLANSRKTGGFCVAGKEMAGSRPGSWIRPVSARSGEEISVSEQRYHDGRRLAVLDIVQIAFSKAVPDGHQIENELIKPGVRWQRVRRAKWSEVERAVDNVDALWHNGVSSGGGENDQVPSEIAAKSTRSLYLIRPERLRLVVETREWGGRTRRVVRAVFAYGGRRYNLQLTDPEFEEAYKRKGEGRYTLKGSLLCVSLGKVFQGFAYKLVAAIITQDLSEEA